MGSTSFSVAATTILAQDLMQSSDVSLRQTNQQETNTVATYTDASGNAAALVILVDKNLYFLTRDTTSASGWAFQPAAGAYTDVAEVVCGTDSLTAQVHALFTASGATYWMTQSSSGSWSVPQSLAGVSGACSNLSVSYTADTGRMVVFAVGANGQLVRATVQEPSGWTASTVNLPGDLLSETSTPPLATYLSEEVWLLAFCNAQGEIVTYEGQGTATTSQPGIISLPAGASANQVIMAFTNSASDGELCLLVTDENGQLYTSGYSGAANTAPPVGLGNTTKIVNAEGWIGADGNFILLASDFAGTLWLVQQTGWAGNGNASWAPSLPILRFAAGISFDSASALSQPPTQLFVQGYDLSLRFIQLNSSGGNWRPMEVRQPSGSSNSSIITYQVRLTLTDTNSVPQPNVSISLTSSKPVFFWCTQGMFLTGPDTSDAVSLVTDSMGGLTLSLPAFSTNTPSLLVWSGETQIGTVQPDQQIHNYLAGQAQQSDLPATFNGSALASASTHNVDGTWNAASPIAPGVTGNSQLANAIAGGMSGCSAATLGLIQGSNAGITEALVGQVGWVVDLTNLGQGFQAFSEQQAFDNAYQQVFGESPESARSVRTISYSIFDDIGSLLDAAWNLAVSIQRFAWEFESNSLSLIFDLGDDVAHFVVAAIEDPADIGAAFHALISQASGQIGDFLDWLASYLPFAQFKIAQRIVADTFTSLPNSISSQISTGQAEFNSWISSSRAAIDEAFSNTVAKYQGQTIAQAFGNLTAAPLALVAGSNPGAQQASGPRSQWFFTRIMNCGSSNAYSWADYQGSTPNFDSLTTQLSSPGADLSSLAESFLSLGSSLSTIFADLATAETTPIGQLLTNLDSLLDSILDLIQEIGDLLFEAGIEGCDCFSYVMQQPLLSFLGPLGTLIQDIGSIAGVDIDPSAGTVLSWALAIPMVLISLDLGDLGMWQQEVSTSLIEGRLGMGAEFDSQGMSFLLKMATCTAIVGTVFTDLMVALKVPPQAEILVSLFGNTAWAFALGVACADGVFGGSKWPGRLALVLDSVLVFINYGFIYRAVQACRQGMRQRALMNFESTYGANVTKSSMTGPVIVSAVGLLQVVLVALDSLEGDVAVVSCTLPTCINLTEFLAAFTPYGLAGKEVLNALAFGVVIVTA